MRSNVVFKINTSSRQRTEPRTNLMSMSNTHQHLQRSPVMSVAPVVPLQPRQTPRSNFDMFGNIIKLVNSGKGCNSCGGAK